MNKKAYLPVWTDGLSYDEQHLTYWISSNMERVDDRYSFLPIRMLGNFFCDRDTYYQSRSISQVDFQRSDDIRWCWFQSNIMPLSYYIAQKAFDAAANRFFAEYPNSLAVQFGSQNFNGVYNTSFSLDFETRMRLFQQILSEEISKRQTTDEFITFDKSYDSVRKELTCKVSGALNLSEEEINDFFHKLDYRDHSYVPQKNILVSEEQIRAHYTVIPEKIFILSNQYIKYEQNSVFLCEYFEAARNRDLALIKKHIDEGVDINSINKDGMTAFGIYISSVLEGKRPCRIADLEELIHLGANPAIYGAGFDEDPLSNECLCRKFETVSFLLACGVNPHVYPCIDEPGDYMSETLLERTERWSEGEPLVNAGPDKDMKRILTMLQKYA